jgi:hypothetical protein
MKEAFGPGLQQCEFPQLESILQEDTAQGPSGWLRAGADQSAGLRTGSLSPAFRIVE